MKTKNLLCNERGIAILMAMFVLFVVTIAGITIIVTASSDKISSGNSSAIRNVLTAANASLIACENQLSKDPQVITEVLNKYINDNSYKWLLVSSASDSKNAKKVNMGDSRLKYSVEISAYDKINNILQIQGTGYGNSSEEKHITSIYKLTGLRYVEPSHEVKYALYLAGSGRNIDNIIDVTGDVYCGSDFHFNSGAANSTVHGVLKTGKNTNLESSSDATGLVIDSAVYIGTKFKINNSITFKGKTGIEGLMSIGALMTIKSDAWFNDTNSGSSSINLSSNTVHHSGKIKMSRVTNGIEDNRHSTITDIVSQLAVGSVNDNPWTVDTAGLQAKAIIIPASITSDIINKMYDTCSSSHKVNGYMVLYDGLSSVGLNPSATAFKCKVIWILRNGLNINGVFSTMLPASRMFIYACGNAQINGFGGPNNALFNGVVYLTDNAKITLAGTGTNTIQGAIHLASSSASWQLNSGSAKLYLVFNNEVITEFETMGILKLPNQPAVCTAGTIILTDVKISFEKAAVLY
jgi:Tfp pilus assembly protein PilX